MKKVFIFIFLALILAGGGVFFWRQAFADMGDPIITVPADEPEGEPIDIYASFSQAQVDSIKKRVMKNMARTYNGGEPINEAEMREIVNYLVAVASTRFNVRVDNLYIADGVEQAVGAQAVCFKDYDAENKTAFETFLIDKPAYDRAKTDTNAMIRLMYIVIHETCHGFEPNASHRPLSLSGLVFNLWYDAGLVIPEYMNNEYRSQIHEMLTDVLACEVILNEFVPSLDLDGYAVSGFEGYTVEATYKSQLKDRGQKLLMAVFPNMQNVFGIAAYNDSPMVPSVTVAYQSGQIEPNAALAPLFDANGGYAVPSFAEFLTYMDKTYGINQIKSGFNEKTLNGFDVEELKRFTLCAPYILGIADIPSGVRYESYERYITDLAGQYEDLKILKDIDRIWVPDWAADVSNKEFGTLLEEYFTKSP